MAIDLDLGFGEPCAVDDAGVVEGVGEDEVVFTCESAEHGEIGLKTAGKDEGAFLIAEGCQGLFEGFMDG